MSACSRNSLRSAEIARCVADDLKLWAMARAGCCWNMDPESAAVSPICLPILRMNSLSDSEAVGAAVCDLDPDRGCSPSLLLSRLLLALLALSLPLPLPLLLNAAWLKSARASPDPASKHVTRVGGVWRQRTVLTFRLVRVLFVRDFVRGLLCEDVVHRRACDKLVRFQRMNFCVVAHLRCRCGKSRSGPTASLLRRPTRTSRWLAHRHRVQIGCGSDHGSHESARVSHR